MRLTEFAAVAVGSVAALVGFAGAANASATVDLIWIDVSATNAAGDPLCLRPQGIAGGGRDCPQLGTAISSVAVSDNITLAVILTAGPGGSMGGAVSVDYSGILPTMSVVDFQPLATTIPRVYLPLILGTVINQAPFIDNINAGALLPAGAGIGLPSGVSAYLGTVSFHKDLDINGVFEIAVGTNGPRGLDAVLDADGGDISGTTTFNSAYLVGIGDPPICTLEIEANALRAGGKKVKAGPNQTVNVTAKARILKGTAASGTTIDTTLTVKAVDGTAVIGQNSKGPITLGVGKGGTPTKLSVGIPQCNSGSIDFVATFLGTDADSNVCEGTRTLRRECR